jgi:hypothetical protein
VVAVAVLLGVRGRRGLASGAGRDRYRRLFLLDAALLVGVASISSALTLVGPHGTHAGHDGHPIGSPRCAMSVDGIGTTVVADPGTPGTNELTVTGPDPSVQGVTLELEHPYAEGAALEVPLTPHEHGWSSTAAMPFTGTWTATVQVRVDDFTQRSGSCDLTIAP